MCESLTDGNQLFHAGIASFAFTSIIFILMRMSFRYGGGGYSNGYSGSNGYGSYGGGGGSYGGDRMSGLGAGLRTQDWGRSLTLKAYHFLAY